MTTDTTPLDHLAPDLPLNRIAGVIAFVCETLGWYEDARTYGEDLALLHSEISEALEAYREHGYADVTEQLCLHRGGDLGLGAHDPNGHLCKPEGVGSELADVVIRLLDTYHRRDLLQRPMWWTWPLQDVVLPHVYGDTFGDQIAQLHMLITLQQLDAVLPAAAAIARQADVDLSAEIVRKIQFNATRGHRHGGKRL